MDKGAYEELRTALAELAGVTPSQITDQTRPIGDLDMESQDGVAFACRLEELGYVLPDKVNPFVDDARQSARTFGEIVQVIIQQARKEPVNG